VLDPEPGNVDAWDTTLDPYSYRVAFFRWDNATTNFVDNANGSTTVHYRGGVDRGL